MSTNGHRRSEANPFIASYDRVDAAFEGQLPPNRQNLKAQVDKTRFDAVLLAQAIITKARTESR